MEPAEAGHEVSGSLRLGEPLPELAGDVEMGRGRDDLARRHAPLEGVAQAAAGRDEAAATLCRRREQCLEFLGYASLHGLLAVRTW